MSVSKATGRPIGAVWPHSDGEGFNMKLDYLPLNGAEMVIRKPKPGADEAEETPGAAQGDFTPAGSRSRDLCMHGSWYVLPTIPNAT